MEHILQFGVNIDDDAIVKAVTEKAEREVIGDIKNRVNQNIDNSMYDRGYWVGDKDLKPWVKDEFVKFLESHKDEIISIACDKLADKLSRTKRVKDAVGDVIKEFDT